MNFKSDIDFSHHLISSCWEKPSRGPVKKCKSGWKVVIALIMSNLNFLFCRSSNSSEYQNIHWLLASIAWLHRLVFSNYYNSRPSQDTLSLFIVINLKLWCFCIETKQDQWERWATFARRVPEGKYLAPYKAILTISAENHYTNILKVYFPPYSFFLLLFIMTTYQGTKVGICGGELWWYKTQGR